MAENRDERGRYLKGHEGGPGRGRTADDMLRPGRGMSSARPPATTGEVPRLLAAMRRVADQDPKHDRPGMEQSCRHWLNEDARGFMKELAVLEGKVAHREAEAPGSVDAPDRGSERIDVLIQKLLDEANAHKGQGS